MIFGINDAGAVGIIKDKMPHELPPNAWSGGNNVRFSDGYAQKTDGYAAVFGAPSIAPYAILPVPAQNTYNWIYAGLDKVYVFDGNTHTNITRQSAGVDVDYTGTVDNGWTGGVLGGIPILNNGVDPPQMWNPATIGTKLDLLTNWPGSTTCEVIRVYKQFLVGLNLNKSGVRYPTTLKWSHPADPGTVPISWSETDPTKDAGEYTFSETGDWLVDCLPLRDTNVVYKENTVWSMQHIGGVDIFRFSKMFGTFGALSKNAVTEFLTGRHLVLTQGDVVVHDGQSVESVITTKWRRWISQNINQYAIGHSFVVANTPREEVWICIPTGTSELPDVALVWNWRTGAIGRRELPLVSHIAQGLVNLTTPGVESWDSDTDTWDSDTTVWGEKLYTSAEPGFLMAVPGLPALYKADYTTDNAGVAQEAYLERTGIGIPLKQGLPPDFTSMKFIQNIWPRIDGTVGGVVKVSVGTQMEIGGAVTWRREQNYVIGTTQHIDCFLSGRLLAIKFSSDTSLQWRLHGYEVDVDLGGNY